MVGSLEAKLTFHVMAFSFLKGSCCPISKFFQLKIVFRSTCQLSSSLRKRLIVRRFTRQPTFVSCSSAKKANLLKMKRNLRKRYFNVIFRFNCIFILRIISISKHYWLFPSFYITFWSKCRVIQFEVIIGKMIGWRKCFSSFD